jgi:hypothetical protein
LVVTTVQWGCDPDTGLDGAVDPAAHHEPPDLSTLPAPEGEAKTPPGERAGPPAGPKTDVTGLPHPDKPFPTPAAAEAACKLSCEREARSDDDRATCRLACGDGKADRPAQVTRRFLDCTRACDPKDRGCVVTCGDAVRQVGREELAYDPFCASVCLDTLPRCRGECLGQVHDDSATCRVRCEQDGARCLRACSERAEAADQAAATPHSPQALAKAAKAVGADDAGDRARRLVDDAARDLGTMLVDLRASRSDPKVIADIERRLTALAHRLGEGVLVSSDELDPEARAALDTYGDTKLTIPLRNLMKEVGEARAK